jgi:predicted O-methyltransferase YrrM
MDSQASDPNELGYSLVNVGEILLGCLDAARPASVLEIGAYRGELTAELLEWAARSGARITAVEPEPPPRLLELAGAKPELELLRETSHDALRRSDPPGAVVIDGDHNYYTLSEELRLISERAPGAEMPLVLLHDVCWPHARRDTYYAPERIPETQRQPLAQNAGLAPWEPGTVAHGLPFIWAAAREGGPQNGTLTAVEDFIAAREGLRLAVVPAFFGFGVLWHRDAPWATAVAEVVDPWDRHPVLERLEANRVAHLSSAYIRRRELWEERQRRAALEELLYAILGSSAFALAERLARLRARGEPTYSRKRIRQVLGISARDAHNK